IRVGGCAKAVDGAHVVAEFARARRIRERGDARTDTAHGRRVGPRVSDTLLAFDLKRGLVARVVRPLYLDRAAAEIRGSAVAWRGRRRTAGLHGQRDRG